MNSSSSKEYFDLRLRIKLDKESEEAAILRYLVKRKNLPFNYKEMILKSIKAFWLPLVYKNQNAHSLAQLSFQETVCSFKKHINYLQKQINCLDFNFEIESSQEFVVDQCQGHLQALPLQNGVLTDSIRIQKSKNDITQEEQKPLNLSGDLAFFEVKKK